MTSKHDSNTNTLSELEAVMVIENPAVVPVIFHEKKSQILRILIAKEQTIIDLKRETKMNPGTIKRHLDGLLEHNLIIISRTEKNEYGMVMKYYRAVAQKYDFNISWP